MYVATFGCMHASFGCMSMERLGAKYLLGAKYAVVGCIYIEGLGACMRLLGARRWSGWVHA